MRLPVLSLLLLSAACALASPASAQYTSLQPPPVPPQNPITPEKAVLGKILFFEEQLASDNTVACGTCHIPGLSFTDDRPAVWLGPDGIPETLDDVFGSFGVVNMDLNQDYDPDPDFVLSPQVTHRRTNDIFGALYAPNIFWDGRASDAFEDPETGLIVIPTGGALESQAIAPLLSPVEQGHRFRTWDQIRTKLQTIQPLRLASDLTPDIVAALAVDPTYPELFEAAFGTTDINAERIAFALATYQRTLVPDQTPWDDFINGNPNALTPRQLDGWQQFDGIAKCSQCHTPPVFSDGDFHNNGFRPWQMDPGLMDTTGLFDDRGKFKTPSLRNAGLRKRFFHNGAFQQMFPAGVSNVYWGGGGGFDDNLDPIFTPLSQIPGIDRERIFEFVAVALTDPRVENELPPFDRPTLRYENFTFGQNLFGQPTPGRFGDAPLITANSPAMIGTVQELRIGLSRAPAGETAHLFGSRGRGFGIIRGGVALNVRFPLVIHEIVTVDGPGPVRGHKTVKLDIPNNPAIVGTNLYFQWVVEDTQAPTGASASRGAVVEILP